MLHFITDNSKPYESYGTNELGRTTINEREDDDDWVPQTRNSTILSMETSSRRKQFAIMPPVDMCRLFLLCGLILLSFVSVRRQLLGSNVILETSLSTNFSIDDVDFTFRRVGYSTPVIFKSDKSDYIQYRILEDVHAIIEPFAPMILSSPSNTDILEYKINFHFRACQYVDNSPICTEGKLDSSWSGFDDDYGGESFQPVAIDCKPYDAISITVHAIDPTTSVKIGTKKFQALCLYVRRDIEDLTSADLQETMDAMHALWEYDEEEGIQKFSDEFHSALYFSEMHFFNAAQRDSDHIHEGLGFLAQHIKLCSVFEKSMQAVNPKATLPFWEFTSELPRNISIFQSIMFTEETFGSLTPPKDLSRGFTYELDSIESGAIPNGRWKNLKANANVKFTDISSGYGLMRSPWNMNPSPYITRFATNAPPLPTCADYFSALMSNDPTSLLNNIQKGPHASLHSAIGNVFGCDVFDELYADGLIRDEVAKSNLCRQWSYFMKDLYRDRYFVPQTGCVIDATTSSLNEFQCGYQCDSSQLSNLLTAIKALLSGGFVPSEGLTNMQWIQWRDFICSGNGPRVIVGAHMDSTSASDPSFWPAHPTQERLWHAKLMSLQYLGDFDYSGDARNSYVCDTSNCYSDSDSSKDYHDDCCYGHKKEDQWLDFVSADRYSFIGPTNIETILATNPNSPSYSMPYIYDSFDYSHCKQGIDELLQATYIQFTR